MRSLSFVFAFCLLAAVSARADVTIVSDGHPRAAIVVGAKPTPTEALAAEELQWHIRKMSGATLPIAAHAPKGLLPIYIGRSAATVGVQADDLELEHYRIKTGPDWLAIAGRDGPDTDKPLVVHTGQVGTLFGVYHLLDHVLGVRWLWPGETGMVVPSRGTVRIPPLEMTHGPRLVKRMIRAQRSRRSHRERKTSVEGVDVLPQEVADRLGREESLWLRRNQMGTRARFGFGHAFTRWWDKYGKTHPEFFATLHGKKQPYPKPERVKFCVSNPAVIEQIVKDWEAGGAGNAVRACPNDSRAYCTCERCRSWDLPVKTTPENVDDSVLTYRYVRFWNAIAGKVATINPDARVYGYAYSNYRRPPHGMKLHSNIILGYTAGIWSMPRGGGYDVYEDWKGWSEAGAKLFLRPNWFHAGYIWPYLPLHDAGEFFKFAYAHGMQGTDFDSLLGHWATQGPYYYLVARMHVRPDMSADEVIEEYCSAFGSAGPAIRDYLAFWEEYTRGHRDRMIALGEKVGLRLGRRRDGTAAMAYLFSGEVLPKAEAILARAHDLARGDGPEVASRIRFLRLGLDHVRLTSEALRKAWAEGGRKAKQGTEKHAAMLRAAAALRTFRREHAGTGFDWTEFSDAWEIGLGDYSGLRALGREGVRAP